MTLLLANSASSITINLRLVYTTVQLSIKYIVVVLQNDCSSGLCRVIYFVYNPLGYTSTWLSATLMHS